MRHFLSTEACSARSIHPARWPWLMILNRTCIVLIQCYKMFVSPLLGSHCRFSPTCSSYALLAFEKYDFFRALLMVFKRICKCHPLHPGGYDPV